ncbi:hypothetical protein CWIS_13565 [Cellulomonas sp. A375-1]|nr:hypothetical protein CWIS_13565 [Cellulomonas sp. A375-1]
MTWGFLLKQWALVEVDLHQTFGVDLEDPALAGRSWRWLRRRILALVTTDTRTSRALQDTRR